MWSTGQIWLENKTLKELQILNICQCLQKNKPSVFIQIGALFCIGLILKSLAQEIL